MFNFFIKKQVEPDKILLQANDLYVKNKYDAAIKKYAELLKIDDNNFPAVANTATAYFELQKYDMAIPFFIRAIKYDSSNPWWYNYISQSMQKCGDYEGALYNAWQAVLMGENENAHHLNLAYTIYEIFDEKGVEKIDSILNKWYKKYPKNPIAEQCYKSFNFDVDFKRSNREYVRELFDVFASDFDDVLSELGYDSPKIIAQYLYDFMGEKKNENISILDLGCGSGLCGKHIKKMFKKSLLTGVDISSKMLHKAEEKNVYVKLVEDDVINCFDGEKTSFDVGVASDVLTYFGELNSVFEKVKKLLKKNGVFIFTVSENNFNEKDYFLMPSSRFVHTQKYVEKLLQKHNFNIVKNDKKILRKEGDRDVVGRIFLVQKM